jgi:hypothetical protein
MKALVGAIGLTDTATRSHTADGDHERFAHYAPKNEVMQALVEGTPIVALCGKTWVPHRDPSKYPVCPTCEEIFVGLSDRSF